MRGPFISRNQVISCLNLVGGSARESNPPTPLVTRHNGFEVVTRLSHLSHLQDDRGLVIICADRLEWIASVSKKPCYCRRYPFLGKRDYPTKDVEIRSREGSTSGVVINNLLELGARPKSGMIDGGTKTRIF